MKTPVLFNGCGIAVVAFLIFSSVSSSKAEEATCLDKVTEAVERTSREHPRLLIGSEDIERLKRAINEEERVGKVYGKIRKYAEEVLDDKPVERRKVGKRLLGRSRECLERVTHLALVYRITGEKKFLERAEREMLAAAGFSDWNLSHFLDVAEMTTALSIGYDWLYHDLPAESRAQIKEAIMEKGIRPSLEGHDYWLRVENNWNQVCNAGMSFGALALLEDEPELAAEIVHRSVNSVRIAMAEYRPDGAYPEGPGYWNYGTQFNVLLIAGLESALGTDFGLTDEPGFMETPLYYMNMIAPSGKYYNYSDCGEGGGVSEAMYWFAKRLDRPELLWMERKAMDRFLDSGRNSAGRLFPLVLVWKDSMGASRPPEKTAWLGRGDTPVAVFRSSWTNPDAVFAGIKGGSPGANHAHMDIGSFVMESDGVRWALDLGAQNYNSLESKGLSIWNRSQDSDRWRVFRYSNKAHSTLVVNGKHQMVDSFSPIVEFSDDKEDAHAVVDMTPAYEGQLAVARRSLELTGDNRVLVRDEVKATKKAASVRWAMVTPAKVEIQGDGAEAVLEKDGKRLRLRVLEPDGVELEVYSTEPPAAHDAPNPGTRMIGFKLQLEPNEETAAAVELSR